ncbi:hypothetical protein SAMN05446037_101234 [Anaerovirgula multivorans]|uniref:Uncharacterized protein n=1 Tax=Anaerovirgula multivorans TaxID=312168 RepID=A0A239F6P0_9FIRM|nr:hypothetical protein [Anaerovirgula multivorans]SNS52485.1 hypothetical protein SAMN05446037_101234 [Anaerovirgula multivorans]
MLKKLSSVREGLRSIKYKEIYNIVLYEKIVKEINKINYENLSDTAFYSKGN